MKEQLIDRISRGEEKLFTMKEVMKILNISRSTLERMLDNGNFPMPCIKLGKGYQRWTETRIKDFLRISLE